MDRLLGAAAVNSSHYHLSVRWLVQQFENVKRPGADVVFVHLAKQYCHSAKAIGVDTAVQQRILYKARVFGKNMTGTIIDNFTVRDTAQQPLSLFDKLGAVYTIVYFYSPLCQHCIEATPGIYRATSAYNPTALRVIAVAVDPEIAVWKPFIDQYKGWTHGIVSEKNNPIIDQFAVYNLPVIYVLDKDKRVVARFIEPEMLVESIPSLMR
jgi:peroxiredoxin